MGDGNDFDRQNIAEFLANAGQVGGMLEGMPLLLLHATGANSGLERVNPVADQPLDDWWAIVASEAGATIEVGSDTVAATARVSTGDERARIWSTQKTNLPTFADDERTAGDRETPAIVLEPA